MALFITDALDSELVGARITAVAGHPIEDVLATLDPLVARDSPATVPGIPSLLLPARRRARRVSASSTTTRA